MTTSPSSIRYDLLVRNATLPDGRRGLDIAVRDGRIEAVARTPILGFRDDVVVRVRADPDGARVDIRSTSRYGRHDFGTNAARVSALAEAIEEAVDELKPEKAPEQAKKTKKTEKAKNQPADKRR